MQEAIPTIKPVRCTECAYPLIEGVCENPGCIVDKSTTHIAHILKCREVYRRKQQYLQQHKGIDYSLSFGTPKNTKGKI